MTATRAMAQPTTLSGAEQRFLRIHADLGRQSTLLLQENPASAHGLMRCDTASARPRGIVYSAFSNAGTQGDFLPYDGRGAWDLRIGAAGTLPASDAGTLSGRIRYGRGQHCDVGWNATRQAEYYRPYFSTDSVGGTFTYDSYQAEGGYSFSAGACWTLGAKVSFLGEQAWRLTDPRALNNTTWLSFEAGAVRNSNGHLLLFGTGYARNKQHMQLRYWRPGQQDRFFVCYGFGLYDTRKSSVSSGKSRMYYMDRLGGQVQYLSPQKKSVKVHAALQYSYFRMRTEEGDIYNLYESGTHVVTPLFRLGFDLSGVWGLHLGFAGEVIVRQGMENIIEEYLIDPANNIYDFRTIDTQRNYGFSGYHLSGTLELVRRFGASSAFLQTGVFSDGFREHYRVGGYRIHCGSLTPHVKAGVRGGGVDSLEFSVLYGRKRVVSHGYEVDFSHSRIPHLDFQQAFAPYAWHASNLHHVTASAVWTHRFGRYSAGLVLDVLLTCGARLPGVAFVDAIGFSSSAPMISPLPDVHHEQRLALTVFLIL